MKSKFTHEERQAILDRYISKSESPTSIIKSAESQKALFINGYPIIKLNKQKQNEKA